MAEKKYKAVFDWGDTVYLKTDPNQVAYLCIGHDISPNGILYKIQHNTDEPRLALLLELSAEKDLSLPQKKEDE